MRKLLVLTGAAGIAAFVARKLKQREPAWHSAPEPTPPAPTESADDAAGAGPDEALADAVEEPHAATTPDAPLEEHEVPAEPS